MLFWSGLLAGNLVPGIPAGVLCLAVERIAITLYPLRYTSGLKRSLAAISAIATALLTAINFAVVLLYPNDTFDISELSFSICFCHSLDLEICLIPRSMLDLCVYDLRDGSGRLRRRPYPISGAEFFRLIRLLFDLLSAQLLVLDQGSLG